MHRQDYHRVHVSGATGNPNAPWLIFLHGLGGGPSDWAAVAPAFTDDYRILTFAQAGSWDADPAGFSPFRHSTTFGFADDLGMLCGDLGIRGAVFVGHSLGANAGVLAAAGDPNLFGGLVLVNASPRYTDDPETGFTSAFSAEELERLLYEMRVDYESWANGFGALAMGNPDRPELAAAFVATLRSLEPRLAISSFRAALTADLRALYRRITVPTLVLQSSEDPAVRTDVARWIATAVPSAHLVELRSTGHFPHLADPDEVVAAIGSFLRDVGAQP